MAIEGTYWRKVYTHMCLVHMSLVLVMLLSTYENPSIIYVTKEKHTLLNRLQRSVLLFSPRLMERKWCNIGIMLKLCPYKSKSNYM